MRNTSDAKEYQILERTLLTIQKQLKNLEK